MHRKSFTQIPTNTLVKSSITIKHEQHTYSTHNHRQWKSSLLTHLLSPRGLRSPAYGLFPCRRHFVQQGLEGRRPQNAGTSVATVSSGDSTLRWLRAAMVSLEHGEWKNILRRQTSSRIPSSWVSWTSCKSKNGRARVELIDGIRAG